jgi:Mn-dependent DtxR family transcriptional regulator
MVKPTGPTNYNLRKLKEMGLINWKRKGYLEITEVGRRILAYI